MNPILRNVLAVVAGLVVGNVVNGFLISISGSVIPLPEGVDPNDMESLKAAMPTFPTKNFIMPFAPAYAAAPVPQPYPVNWRESGQMSRIYIGTQARQRPLLLQSCCGEHSFA